jgi:hypothetical protein
VVGPSAIPFVPAVLGQRCGYFSSRVPLQTLIDLNYAHWQVLTDRRHIMHIACVPMLVRVGYSPPAEGDGVQEVSQNIMIDIPQGGDLRWLEASGAGIAPTAEELTQIENRMANVSIAFLQPDTRAAETAEAKRLDAQASNATLASVARAHQDAFELAAQFDAEYMNEEPPEIGFNLDFAGETIAPDLIAQLSSMAAQNQLSLETMLTIIKSGGVLPDEVEPREEVQRIARQPQPKLLAAPAAGGAPPAVPPPPT